MFAVILLFFLILAIFLPLFKQYQNYIKIKHIPGPIPLPFIGNALELGTNNLELLTNLERLVKKYGSILRLCIGTQNGILLVDPKLIGQALIAADDYYKGDFYKILGPLIGNGLVSSSGKKWARHRRILNMAFSKKQLEKYVDIFNNQGTKLVNEMKKRVGDAPTDLSDLIFICTFNIVSQAVMGLDIVEHPKYHEVVTKLVALCMKRFTSPLRRVEFLHSLTEDFRQSKKFTAKIEDIVVNIVETCRQNMDEDSSILSQLFRMSKEDLLTDEDLKDEINTFVIAGSETTGTLVSFALYELSKNPTIQEKVLKEIEDILGPNIDGDINYESLHELKYLECVVKETMRMYAPAPMITRVLPNEVQMGDYKIPADTTVIIFLHGLHKLETVFPDPEKFDPNRFLAENCADRNPYAFIPFAAGPRVCIGQKFAMLEVKVILAKILRRFQFVECQKHKPKLNISGSMISTNGLPVLLKIRTP